MPVTGVVRALAGVGRATSATTMKGRDRAKGKRALLTVRSSPVRVEEFLPQQSTSGRQRSIDPPGPVSADPTKVDQPQPRHRPLSTMSRDSSCPCRGTSQSGGSGIRTHGTHEAQRFSRPPDSATLASLRPKGYSRRRWAKNAESSADASSARTPAVIGTSWLSLGSAHRLYSDPQAPAFESAAP